MFFSVFGNLRRMISMLLVHSDEKLKKCVAKPSFVRSQIFNDDLVGVLSQQTNLFLKKPIYVWTSHIGSFVMVDVPLSL